MWQQLYKIRIDFCCYMNNIKQYTYFWMYLLDYMSSFKMDSERGKSPRNSQFQIFIFEKSPISNNQCGIFETQMKITRLDLRISVIHPCHHPQCYLYSTIFHFNKRDTSFFKKRAHTTIWHSGSPLYLIFLWNVQHLSSTETNPMKHHTNKIQVTVTWQTTLQRQN